MLLLIDNYDSFTYNLVQYLGELGADVHVHRNDTLTLEQLGDGRPVVADHVDLRPELAQILDEVVGERIVVIDDNDHMVQSESQNRSQALLRQIQGV